MRSSGAAHALFFRKDGGSRKPGGSRPSKIAALSYRCRLKATSRAPLLGLSSSISNRGSVTSRHGLRQIWSLSRKRRLRKFALEATALERGVLSTDRPSRVGGRFSQSDPLARDLPVPLGRQAADVRVHRYSGSV